MVTTELSPSWCQQEKNEKHFLSCPPNERRKICPQLQKIFPKIFNKYKATYPIIKITNKSPNKGKSWNYSWSVEKNIANNIKSIIKYDACEHLDKLFNVNIILNFKNLLVQNPDISVSFCT